MFGDDQSEHEEHGATGQAAQHLGPPPAVGQRFTARARNISQDTERQRERTRVREHVGRVGQERERVRDDSNDNLEGHEPDNQQQRDCQIPTVRVHTRAVGADSVRVISVLVAMRFHLSMPILITIQSFMVVPVTPRHSS